MELNRLHMSKKLPLGLLVFLLMYLFALIAWFSFGTSSVEETWYRGIPAKMPDGTPIEIVAFPSPTEDGVFVVSVHRDDDPLGSCWWTTIKPEPVK